MDSVASLLDADLDDLADAPSFEVPPAGAYNATVISWEEKKIGENACIEIKLRLNSTMELANAADTPVADGTETSTVYNTTNEFGVGDLKEFLKPIKAAHGTVTTRESLDAARGTEIMLVTGVRKGKKGTDSEDKTYLKIKKVEVL